MFNLDFVRSLAVISVVIEHVLLALNIQRLGPYEVRYLGIPGVMLFFVLTALVLMWSLDRKPHTLDFYIRRVFRIYPLVIAVILAVVLFRAPVAGTPAEFFAYGHPHIKDVLVSMALMQNFTPTRPILGVLWTLPYEVQMYLLLPFLYFFLRRNYSLWPLLLLWSFIILETRGLPSEGHNFAVAMGYFLPGAMAYVGFGKWRPRLPGALLPAYLLALWAVFLYHMDFHKGWYFCLIVGLTLPFFRSIKSNWLIAPSRIIARYSYGVYLTHPFALAIGLYLLRGHSVPVRCLGVLVPLVVLPVAAYHLIEHPMIRLGSRLAAKAESRYEQQQQKARPRLTPA